MRVSGLSNKPGRGEAEAGRDGGGGGPEPAPDLTQGETRRAAGTEQGEVQRLREGDGSGLPEPRLLQPGGALQH